MNSAKVWNEGIKYDTKNLAAIYSKTRNMQKFSRTIKVNCVNTDMIQVDNKNKKFNIVGQYMFD
ncbi:porin [Arsenophonus endosymbiont of Aleurodicus dispersus]|uniref:porin n=1 Tax=Arsenophonus endosymbiont of Aleurodicus dispersus TaxID=235559 RepID=UPI00350E5852